MDGLIVILFGLYLVADIGFIHAPPVYVKHQSIVFRKTCCLAASGDVIVMQQIRLELCELCCKWCEMELLSQRMQKESSCDERYYHTNSFKSKDVGGCGMISQILNSYCDF